MIRYGLIEKDSLVMFADLMPPMKKKLLQTNPRAFVLGATIDDNACGVVLCVEDDDYIWINWIAVDDEHRRMHIATGMLEKLTEIAYDAEKLVIASLLVSEPGEDVLWRLFDRSGLFYLKEQVGFTCVANIDEFLEFRKGLKADTKKLSRIVPLNKLSDRQRKQLMNNLYNGTALMSQINTDEIDDSLSFTITGKPGGATFIVSKLPEEGAYELSLAYCEREYASELVYLYMVLADELEKLGDKFSYLTACAVNEQSAELIRKMVPKARVQKKAYVAVWDFER